MSMANASIIRLARIKKVFHTDEVETHAVADVHLEIARGQYVCIAGPSGSGKTTLLALIGLLDTPTSGTVMGLLRDLHASGTTIVMVTHNPEYARQAQRTIHLFDGRVLEESVGG
jgi:ABC-type lipoprotein export system ATPase subunit